MKNILNYESLMDFTSADKNNIPPHTWYGSTNTSPNGSFYYYASSQQNYDIESYFSGRVGGVVPGVAYLKDGGEVIYNNMYPKIEAPGQTIETTWETLGITRQIYNQFHMMLMNREPLYAFNVTIGGVKITGAGIGQPDDFYSTEYLIFGTNSLQLYIYDDGNVRIYSTVM